MAGGRLRYSPDMWEWLQRFWKPEPSKTALGDRGENVAARYLRGEGFKIIVRNYRCALGEVDIIARDGDTLVFVEVKTRVSDEPMPEDQVNDHKQHQISKVAKYYLGRYGIPQPPVRFDVVAIVWPTGRTPQVRHTPAAFEVSF